MEKTKIKEQGKKFYEDFDTTCERNAKVCAKILAVNQCNTVYKDKEDAQTCTDSIETHIKEQAEGYRNLMGFLGMSMRKKD